MLAPCFCSVDDLIVCDRLRRDVALGPVLFNYTLDSLLRVVILCCTGKLNAEWHLGDLVNEVLQVKDVKLFPVLMLSCDIDLIGKLKCNNSGVELVYLGVFNSLCRVGIELQLVDRAPLSLRVPLSIEDGLTSSANCVLADHVG